MRTNSAIIGLVLVVIVMAGCIYLTSDHTSEEITVECSFTQEIGPWEVEDQPVIGGRAYIVFTSNKDTEKVIDSWPDLVMTKDGKSVTLHPYMPKTVTWKDRYSIGLYLYYFTNGADYEGWDHHFELTESMKKAGNYKLIE